ncbi:MULTISPECIES: ABC transporter substrate-binding protein [Hyphomicrobium]|uniref:ABC transporter substrate-binding protein n=1 Tax=Hyphomicrobium TaxID=81 RepID=UPI000362FD89|nr:MULTISPECIES: NrtA/SsuA/CpmA family ABC transporter substrate-binding protein [Hyphomicrobium]WBT38784.1 NrtA/SsuA/CpmA family ABC transporter substrate-binding protein [Hyphomicrobium sp. DMF-1]HML42935.1 NrtA/SsuA/CpmA family ABC transporter substrate-binding protein [Hyphomicrobium zavarzinii]
MSRSLLRVIALAAVGLLSLQGQSQAENAKIRIGYPSGMNGQVPVVLQKAGLAAKHDLDAEFTGFQFGPPLMEGLASGQLDAVVTSFIPPFNLALKSPGSIKFVASLGQSSHSLLVPKDSQAKTIEDLKGKKIGLSLNTESHLDLLILLKDKGIDKDAFEYVNLQPNELPGAIETGLVDAVLIRQPQTQRLETKLGAKRVHTWPFYFTALVRSEYLASNPKAVDAFVEALKDAVFYIATKPDESAAWFAETQRLDASVVKSLAGENPLYGVKSRDDVKITIDDGFKKLLAERLDAGTSFGFVKGKLDPATLVP